MSRSDPRRAATTADPPPAPPVGPVDGRGAPPLAADELRRVLEIERPSPVLWRYYALLSLCAGPLFLLALLALRFRFQSLRYTFDDEGVAMRWGVLFRREIHLTYDRVQDIHLVSNVVERWLGLGRVKIQTASGSAKAEMTIEGLEEFELVRDFLYSRMRGLHRPTVTPTTGDDGEVAVALRQAAAELRALRELLAADRPPRSPAAAAGAETPNSEAPSR